MNDPRIQPTQPPAEATLAEFIKDNSTLLTSMAAFIALAAFSSQWDIDDIKFFFPALPILAAVLLGLELLSKLPPEPRHWRLGTFTYVLTVLVFSMIWYWFKKFPTVWGLVIYTCIPLFLFIVLPASIAHFLVRAAARVTAKVFHREIRAVTTARLSLCLFILLAGFLFIAFIWLSHRLSGRRLHIPI